MAPFNSQEYPNREYWRNNVEEKHIKDSNAGQVTPGNDDLKYLSYCLRVAKPISKIDWLNQQRIMECQKLREG